jgi:hypothetical protein
MIATNRFVFVHVPKTGGEFVRAIIERHFDVSWRSADAGLSYHAPYSALPGEYRELPAFSFVRNPWDCYVSIWAFLARREGPSPMRQAAAKGFPFFLEALQRRISTGGGYAARIDRMTPGTEVLRYEALRHELIRFLVEHEIEHPPDVRTAITEAPRINRSDHRPYQSYYDEHTRQLVATECADMIERFGYEFD